MSRFLLCVLLVAGGCGFAVPCTNQVCSNDPEVLGDEGLAWEIAPDSPLVAWQEIVIQTALIACMSIESDVRYARIAGSPCVASNDTVVLSVRACNAAGCSTPSEGVEFMPYICIQGGECHESDIPANSYCDNREVRCYADAPCRLPAERGCSNG